MTLPFNLNWVDILDILIVAIILYQIFRWLSGTIGMQLLRGLLIIFVIYLVSQQLGLKTLNWLMEKFVTVILIVVIIVFQPELRRALERIGRGRFFQKIGLGAAARGSATVRQIIDAVEKCSINKIGGLFVLEKTTGLGEFLESGVKIDAPISEELLLSIFTPNTPLHDGAVILQGDRILAAGCLLPLSQDNLIDRSLGTRHRAAIGASEQTDAFVIVVSEKTGVISIAENGQLQRAITKEILEEKLFQIYNPAPSKSKLFFWKKDKQK